MSVVVVVEVVPEVQVKFRIKRKIISSEKMARLLVFVLCASMVTTQRNGNVVKKEGGESQVTHVRHCATSFVSF